MKQTALLFSLLLLLLFSCSKKEETYVDASQDYFPLQIGKQVIYEVDSIIWDDFSCKIDTTFHLMRWTVSDTFRDNTNRLVFKIDVDIRANDSASWENSRVYAATINGNYLELHENNLLFIKLVFPVADNTTWKGNNFITTSAPEYQFLFDWDYTYQDAGKNFDNGKQTFENTVTVNEKDETINSPSTADYASRTFAQEVYAKNVGLVYRQMIYWTYDKNVSGCKKGFQVTMRAISHQ